jgi:hypothetical protein
VPVNDENVRSYSCACCGEINEVFIDDTAGKKQRFVEDCAVCCRPNIISILVDNDSGSITIESEFEG